MDKPYLEETTYENGLLPKSWRTTEALRELSDYLQFNWEQRYLFFNDESKNKRQQFLDFTGFNGIRTNKYIGTISFKNERMNIFPKVYKFGTEGCSDEDVHHLFRNILKWLNYCRKSSYPYVNIDSQLDDVDDLRELFVTIYLGYVLEAFKRSRYHKYEEKSEDLSFVKGRIDFSDYILRKYLNGKGDRFLCEYSEFEFDNKLNRIIKCTCSDLLRKSTSEKNRQRIRDILRRLNEVSDVPCTPHDCDSIKLNSVYRHYRVVLSMSKMFLMNKTTNLLSNNQDSFCFLFPSELLFEGFVGGFIEDILCEEASVKLQQSDRYVFEDLSYGDSNFGKAFQTRQDIVVDFNDDHRMIVLDTKYKILPRFEGSEDLKKALTDNVSSSDLYQMVTYAKLMDVSDVYLLYPLLRFEDEEPVIPVGTFHTDSGNDIRVHFVRLPFIFEADETATENTFKRILKTVLSK